MVKSFSARRLQVWTIREEIAAAEFRGETIAQELMDEPENSGDNDNDETITERLPRHRRRAYGSCYLEQRRTKQQHRNTLGAPCTIAQLSMRTAPGPALLLLLLGH